MLRAIPLLFLFSSVAARGDASLPGEPAPGDSQCGSRERSLLKRAVAEFCERDPKADARGCHDVRRALRDCGESPGFVLDRVDNSDEPKSLRVSVRDSDNASFAWFVDFTRDARRVTRFVRLYDDCDGG